MYVNVHTCVHVRAVIEPFIGHKQGKEAASIAQSHNKSFPMGLTIRAGMHADETAGAKS